MTDVLTREVRLTVMQMHYGLEAVRRRRRELQKKERQYAERHRNGIPIKWGMLEHIEKEREELQELERILEHNKNAAANAFAAKVAGV